MSWTTSDELTAAGVLLAVVGVIWAGVTAVLRRTLANDFVTRDGFQGAFDASHATAISPLVQRVSAVEQLQSAAPTTLMVQQVDRRLEVAEKQIDEVQRTITAVQVGVGEVKTGQIGQTAMMKTQARQIDQIFTHLLGERGHE